MNARLIAILLGLAPLTLSWSQPNSPVLSGHRDGKFAPRAQGQLLVNDSYLVDFDGGSGVAFWVHYALLESECQGPAARSDAFRADGRVLNCPDGQSYRGSGFDRGHLKPAADSKSSNAEMRSSFLMTNMAPQSPNLNRGIWKKLEENVRLWGMMHGEVHVTCGPSDLTQGVLASGVRVPEAFWKVILRAGKDTTCLAFRFPNAAKVQGELSDYLVRVDDLEAELGLDLFCDRPDVVEGRIESELHESVWMLDAALGMPTTSPHSVKKTSETDVAVQCMGIASSTGRRCKKTTTDSSGRCPHHREKP